MHDQTETARRATAASAATLIDGHDPRALIADCDAEIAGLDAAHAQRRAELLAERAGYTAALGA